MLDLGELGGYITREVSREGTEKNSPQARRFWVRDANKLKSCRDPGIPTLILKIELDYCYERFRCHNASFVLQGFPLRDYEEREFLTFHAWSVPRRPAMVGDVL